MTRNERLGRLEREYARLKNTLLSLGPVLQGTILSRTIRREDPEKPGRMNLETAVGESKPCWNPFVLASGDSDHRFSC